MQKILSDKMSAKKSLFFFHSEEVKALIRKRGGWAAVAAQLRTSTRTLERTVSNQSRNGRLQRDLLAVLHRNPQAVGYFASTNGHVSPSPTAAAPSLAASTQE